MTEQQPPAWAVRLRDEREARDWNKREMARRLLRAAGYEHGSVDSIARQIRNWEGGRHFPRDWATAYAIAFDVRERELFYGCDEDARTIEEVEPTKRRNALKLGVVAAITPSLLQRVLRDSACEAMEFTRLAGVSSLGAGTLAHLEAATTALNRGYGVEPPVELFTMARTYRRRIGELIRGRHTLKEGRELYVYAAWVSEMLAWLAHDLGDPLAAEAWAIDSFEHADQAAHNELCAWATDALASVSIYTDRPAHAIAAAHRGIAKAAADHPLAIRLRAQAARAHARLGQREECEALLRDAGERYERLPARAPMRFAMDTGNLASLAVTSYPASAYIWLGDGEHGDFEKARAHAQSALAAHMALPAADRSPSREAIARIDLGIALTELGTPDEAAVLGRQALAGTHLVDSVRTRAGDLDRVLTARYPKLGVVQEFHEAYIQAHRSPVAD
ncbi:hypothetical protein AB0M95_23780 [Sphaerisporangium sp. NPDC051017]|uniref:hypothetical protein n=1 Tax=Sphaerisporangium sp. NPDC051017 TaxID=3154636 RepID=UPI0034412AD3